MITTAALTPLQPLFESKRGRLLPLPPKLTRLYGNFRMPLRRSGPEVFSNFVSTMDGVVSLQVKGHSTGGDISGFSVQDRMVMGLLRSIADVIIIGSGTFHADPRHVWTPESICPELANDYDRLRKATTTREAPLNVIVSASGDLDLRLPVFISGRVPVLIVTTQVGARRLGENEPPSWVDIRPVRRGRGDISPSAILDQVSRVNSGPRILIEGGPRLLGAFYEARLVNEQFLTLAPQIAGRETNDGRLSLVMERIFAPRDPLWGTLTDVRRGDSHLFLRYSFKE
ncbi:MAG TPA: dihydrofolate reductase family protein [Steroidobacteraceae bacterium]|jgi:riboflavin biosynthesis pyrimidine reductase|nr:dihydrofolate reductase family protein [Steroidobacteraceae bacterium]